MNARQILAGALGAALLTLAMSAGATAQWSPNTPGLTDLPTSIPNGVLQQRPDLSIADSVLRQTGSSSCEANAQFQCGTGYTCTDVWQAGRNIRFSCEPVGDSAPSSNAVCSHGHAVMNGDGSYICVMPQ